LSAYFKDDAEKKFILLTGDLSGIQKYIFGINHSTSRGISKIFRARSFFIQAIVQSIILEIEDRLEIYSVCRLMNSGGKFMLLLPNTAAVNQELEKIDYEVQMWFRGNCSLCEINAADDKASENYRSEEGNELPICRDCLEQIT